MMKINVNRPREEIYYQEKREDGEKKWFVSSIKKYFLMAVSIP